MLVKYEECKWLVGSPDRSRYKKRLDKAIKDVRSKKFKS